MWSFAPSRLRGEGLFGEDLAQVRAVAENDDAQGTAGEKPGLQVSPDKYKYGNDKHGRERSDGSLLRPAPFSAEHPKRGIEHEASDRDQGFETQKYAYHRRDPLATVEFQEGAPAVSHHRRQAQGPTKPLGIARRREKENRERSFADIAGQSDSGAPLGTDAEHIIETGVPRTGFPDVDAGSPHGHHSERNRSNEKTGGQFHGEDPEIHFAAYRENCDAALYLNPI